MCDGKKKEGCTVCIAAAIVTIGIVEVVALLNGVNGTLMGMSIATIAGLGGYGAGRIKKEMMEK